MRPKSLTASNSNTCRSVEPAESSFAFLKITGYIATYAPIEQTMSFIHTHPAGLSPLQFQRVLQALKGQLHSMRDVAVHFS